MGNQRGSWGQDSGSHCDFGLNVRPGSCVELAHATLDRRLELRQAPVVACFLGCAYLADLRGDLSTRLLRLRRCPLQLRRVLCSCLRDRKLQLRSSCVLALRTASSKRAAEAVSL